MRRKKNLASRLLVVVTLLFSSAVAFADSVDSFNAWIEVKDVVAPASLSFTEEQYTDVSKDPADSSLALEGPVDLTAVNGYKYTFYASARTSTRTATNLKVDFERLEYNGDYIDYIPLAVTYIVGENSNIVTASQNNQTPFFIMKETLGNGDVAVVRPLSYKIVVSVDSDDIAEKLQIGENNFYSADFTLTFDTEG